MYAGVLIHDDSQSYRFERLCNFSSQIHALKRGLALDQQALSVKACEWVFLAPREKLSRGEESLFLAK